MEQALPGGHYCEKHQGNHSHYASHNCMVCQLEERVEKQAGFLRWLAAAAPNTFVAWQELYEAEQAYGRSIQAG